MAALLSFSSWLGSAKISARSQANTSVNTAVSHGKLIQLSAQPYSQEERPDSQSEQAV
jgi:hypothetical protein